MKQSDVNRRVRVFDRPDGTGLIGVVTDIFDEWTFRIKTDSGRDYEFSTKTGDIKIHFLDGVLP